METNSANRLVIVTILSIGIVGMLAAQSTRSSGPVPKFKELSAEDAARLAKQRALISDTITRRYRTGHLTQAKTDLPIIQKLIDDRAFDKSQTYELQSLGVVFGDVLAHELPLRWMMITDEFGTDPTLRLKNTNTNVNALTMISKRIERGEPVNVLKLFSFTREQLESQKR